MKRQRSKPDEIADDQPWSHMRSRSPLGYRIPLIALVQAVVVAEFLNFRHAANVLGISQSSVSARIKALEEALGVLLFERRHRGVRLTDAGRRFVLEVSEGITHLEHAVRTAGASSGGTEGRLAIGLQASIGFGYLADLRSQFRLGYPMADLVVTEGRSSDMIALVRGGSLDVAFVVGPVEAPDCHCRELWQEPLLIGLPSDHRLMSSPSIAWADLVAETFLIPHAGPGQHMFEHVIRRIAEQKRSSHILRYDVGRDVLMSMVAAGEGITLVSEATAHVPFPGVAFRTVIDESEPARFSAVWSPHNRSPLLKNLLTLAKVMSRSAHRV